MAQRGRRRQNRELDEASGQMDDERARLVSLFRLRRAAKTPQITGCPSAALMPAATAQNALLQIDPFVSLSECVAQIDRLVFGAKRFEHAFAAATVLFTLERGTPRQKAFCEDRIPRLRNTNVGSAIDPYRRMTDREFLDAFIEKCAPGWRWRDCQADVQIHQQVHGQMVQDRVATARFSKAVRNRFVAADAPDAGMLHRLRRIKANDSTTWPTLRELKLATTIPERTIKRIIASLLPKPKAVEVVTIPLRHSFIRRGAAPTRYHPRLALAVLNVFVFRLPDYSIKNEEQERLREIAMTVKRALMSKLRPSRSST